MYHIIYHIMIYLMIKCHIISHYIISFNMVICCFNEHCTVWCSTLRIKLGHYCFRQWSVPYMSSSLCTNADLLSMWSIGTHLSAILIEIEIHDLCISVCQWEQLSMRFFIELTTFHLRKWIRKCLHIVSYFVQGSLGYIIRPIVHTAAILNN